MKINLQLIFSPPDASDALIQTVDAFGRALARRCEVQAPFVNMGELVIQFECAHPIVAVPIKAGGSYHSATNTFIAGAPLEYAPWIGERWEERVRATERGTRAALAKVHETRLSSEERSLLSELIADTVEEISHHPPAVLAALKPVFAVKDPSGKLVGIGYQQGSYLGAGQVVEIPPVDVPDYDWALVPNSAVPATVKLYRRVGGVLQYREAWPTGDGVVEHSGICGQHGKVTVHSAADDQSKRQRLKSFIAEAKGEGFARIPDHRMKTLMVTLPIDGCGTKPDPKRCHELEDFLGEATGWLGLGHCDGGSVGPESMEAFCLVVDYEVAAEALSRELANSLFSDFVVSRGP